MKEDMDWDGGGWIGMEQNKIVMKENRLGLRGMDWDGGVKNCNEGEWIRIDEKGLECN